MSMQPGPELDRLVAEKVMGWRVHNRNTAFYVLAGQEYGPMFNIPKHDACGSLRFAPSTNIAHAWEVVEHVTSPYMPRNPQTGLPPSSHFSALFERYNLWAESASDAAHKICLIALKAVGIDV